MKRRRFVERAGIATIGSLLLPYCTPANKKMEETLTTQINQKKEAGVQLYTLRSLFKDDLVGTIKKVKEIGYSYVELFGYSDRMYFGMPATDFYALVKDAGLSIRSSHHLSGNVNIQAQGTLKNGWEQAVEDATLAGQRYMVCAWLFPEERGSLDQYKKLAEQLNIAGEICKKAGIQFCYHNHDFEFQPLDGQLPMHIMLDNTDPDLLKMELDLYWITKAEQSIQEFFSKYPGRTPLWHVKDMDTSVEKKFADVGSGSIDFKTIFGLKDLAGMQSFFVEQDEPTEPLTSITNSLNYLSKEIL